MSLRSFPDASGVFVSSIRTGGRSGRKPAPGQIDGPGRGRRLRRAAVFGRIAARSTVDLSFRAGGQIEELPIRQGQFVEAGTLLGRLDRGPSNAP
ncbi:biotin/lipoyl-binding protein [Paracoccus marcusii]|uniref:biotin/lipoyl-binding protein n=1 Tax=Paracoccus marcusii TaxID=59779 RepID=UPI0039C85BD7